jgi:hypothetical protein
MQGILPISIPGLVEPMTKDESSTVKVDKNGTGHIRLQFFWNEDARIKVVPTDDTISSIDSIEGIELGAVCFHYLGHRWKYFRTHQWMVKEGKESLKGSRQETSLI